MNVRFACIAGAAVVAGAIAVAGIQPAAAVISTSVSPSPSPTIGPPVPSLPASSPLGAIGLLERDRNTPPTKLADYLHSSDPVVEARAAYAIGRLRNAAGIPLLAAVLADGSAPQPVKVAAAFSLGAIGSADGVRALEGAMRGASAVAGVAADSLGRIGGNLAVFDLIGLLQSPDAFVRGKAAIGLGEAGSPAKPPLAITYREAAARAISAAFGAEQDPEVRWRMAWALSRSYYANAQSTLRLMLSDKQELVRLMALRGLARLADPSFMVSVRLLATDPSWRVRVEARNTLIALADRSTIVDVTPTAVPASDLVTPQPMPSRAPYGDHPQVAFITNRGTIVIEMFPDVAPYNVDSFLHLVDNGIYSNTAFFRVIWDFVAQGGGYKNDPNANPPYTVPAELNPLEQLTGVLALGLNYDSKTNAPELDSGGTQFYITESPQLHLDAAFTTMGRVVRGMDVVDALVEHRPEDGVKGADFAIKVYRCVPVTPQTADAEERLRMLEVDQQAP